MERIAFLFCLWILTPSVALAQARGGNPLNSPVGATAFREKAEKKFGSRWTLKEWLEQKERNRMMDLWLGMYAPSPYELFASVSQQSYDLRVSNPDTSTGYKSTQGSFAFFALILGIEIQHENNWEEDLTSTEGMLHLRVLGNANQGTHLNIFYGSRKYKDVQAEFEQTFVGADFDLYIERHIGLHFNTKSYLPTNDSEILGEVSGRRSEGGLFFDIEFVRFFGNYFEDLMVTQNNTTRVEKTRVGYHYGMKFFF